MADQPNSVRTTRYAPVFTGKAEDFQIWWTRFKAFASVQGFAPALIDHAESDLPATEATPLAAGDAGDNQSAAIKRNNLAVANLTMSFQTDALMGMVYKACDDDWPTGQAWKIVGALKRKYMPDDRISRVELRKALASVMMRKDDDPAKLFEQVSAIENKFNKPGNVIPEEELIAVVISSAPESYIPLLTSEQRARGNALTLQHLEDAMTQQHRQVLGNRNNTDQEDEITLLAFGGVCYRCGGTGHKASTCTGPNNKKQQGKRGNDNKKMRFKGKCSLCGKEGHRASDCWEDPNNAGRKPAWYKAKKAREAAAAAVDIDVELCMMGVTQCSDKGLIQPVDDKSKTTEYTLSLTRTLELPNTTNILSNPNVFVADSGATVHMVFSSEGATNIRRGEGTAVTMGNGKGEITKAVVDIRGTMCNKAGTMLGRGIISDAHLINNGRFNLFSLTKMQSNGWLLSGDSKGIWLTKGAAKIVFDIIIPTKRGRLFAMYFHRDENSPCPEYANGTRDENFRISEKTREHFELNSACTDATPNGKITINNAHDLFGHPNEQMTRNISNMLGLKLANGPLGPCEACNAGKAKQKNVPKTSVHVKANKVGERIFLDIATIKPPPDNSKKIKCNPKNNWLIIVDEKTGRKFSYFMEKKSDLVEIVCKQIHHWIAAGKQVKFIRCDNAGENKKLAEIVNGSQWKLDLQFEYTARNTPQQNHLAELAFATCANRGRSMMHRANIPLDIRYRLFPKALTLATILDGLNICTIDGKTATRFEHFDSKLPKFVNHLHVFGEAGTVTLRVTGTPKLADRGVHCLYLGPALRHAGDVYEMWNPITGRVHETRDVIWLKRMFYERPATHPTIKEDMEDYFPDYQITTKNTSQSNCENASTHETSNTDDEVGESNDISNNDDEPTDDIVIGGEHTNTTTTTTSSGRLIKAPSRLIEEMAATTAELRALTYNIELTPAEEKYFESMKQLNEFKEEFGLVGAGVGGGFQTTDELRPIKFDEAMSSPDHKAWQDAIDEEMQKLKDYKVFRAIKQSQLPKGTKVLTSTWVMKQKANGTKRARITARGFEQVDGLHFDSTSTSAPVANEVTIRIILILAVMAQFELQLIDVRGAFLNGRFENDEKVYMKVPKGFEKYFPQDTVWELLRTLYGTVQAAKQFWKELLSAMNSIGFAKSKADSCLYYKWSSQGPVFWLSWVDDLLCCGPTALVLQDKQKMMERFDCDDVGSVKEYIGCKVEYDKTNMTMRLTQPVLLQSYRDEFNLPEGQDPTTPAPSGMVLEPAAKEENNMQQDLQTEYRKGVGKMLHMMRWSRPDILNAVRELSKFMSGAAMAHYSAMMRVMKYLVSTPDRGLLLQPNTSWNGNADFEFDVQGFADSEYAKEQTTRRSVNGWCVFLNNAFKLRRFTDLRLGRVNLANSMARLLVVSSALID